MRNITWFDKLLSTFGYEALNVVFGVDSSHLSEPDLRALIWLANYAYEHETLWEEIRVRLTDDMSATDRGVMLVSLATSMMDQTP